MTATPESSSIPPLTRAERETETAAQRLVGQVEAALAAVAVRHSNEPEELEAIADRIDRASRDLATALRELSEERQIADEEGAD